MTKENEVKCDATPKIYCPLCHAKVKQEKDSEGYAWCPRHEGRITPEGEK